MSRKLALCLALCAVIVGVAACGGDDDESTPEAAGTGGGGELQEVTLATNPFAGAATAFIAADNGFFDDAGLELKPEFLAVPPDAVAAVVGGDAEFAQINTITLMNAANENIPIQIIAPGYYGNPEEQGLYVAEDSDIQSMADLDGKKIGTAGRGNINELAIVAAAGEAGVDPSSLEFVEIPLPNMAQALRDGKADIGPMVEPYVTLEADKGLREVQDDPYAPYGDEGQVLTYYITSNDLAESDPDLVSAFVGALDQAAELGESDPQVTRDAVAGYTEIDPTVISEMALPGFGTDLRRESMETQAEVALEYEYVDEAPDLDKLFPTE